MAFASAERMAETVKVVCDAEVGLQTLGAMQPMLAAEPPTPRTKALRSLLTQVALEHLRRTYKSGMTFVGQYNGLRALQPWVDPLLFDVDVQVNGSGYRGGSARIVQGVAVRVPMARQ